MSFSRSAKRFLEVDIYRKYSFQTRILKIFVFFF